MSMFRSLLMANAMKPPPPVRPSGGLHTLFEALNNTGLGVLDPNTRTWVDLARGKNGTLLDQASWGADCVHLGTTTGSKVSFPGDLPTGLGDYTVSVTMMFRARSGTYPRIMGENPYPTIYANSASSFVWRYYMGSSDLNFKPDTYADAGVREQLLVRYKTSTKIVEFFRNGVKAGELTNVVAASGVATAYMAGRANNDRTSPLDVSSYALWTRAFTDDEIAQNFAVDQMLYGL